MRHFTSRAGDPTGTCIFRSTPRSSPKVGGGGLHTVGIRDSLEAINSIGHAAVMTNPALRAALAARGLTLDSEAGEVAQMAPHAGAFCAQAKLQATRRLG